MRWMSLLLLLNLTACLGCGKDANTTFTTVGQKIGGTAAPKQSEPPPDETAKQFVALQDAAGQPAKGANPPDKKPDQPRKIRYTADMRLIVEDFDKAEAALDDSRKEAKGDFAKVEITNSANSVRTGTWRIRVPVENLHSFRKAVAKIGEVERNTIDSEDLTAQYYDLKAHIENRTAAREALRDLLKETGKKEMKHYLDVWDKLESVTGEINRMEGQLKLWANLTDLTTCTVNMREKERYIKTKPPETAEVPAFGVRAGKTWSDSLEMLVGFCENVAILAVAVTPWLPIPLAFVLFVWLATRFLVRASKPPVVLAVAEAPTESKKP
jgi:hypothetical protein